MSSDRFINKNWLEFYRWMRERTDFFFKLPIWYGDESFIFIWFEIGKAIILLFLPPWQAYPFYFTTLSQTYQARGFFSGVISIVSENSTFQLNLSARNGKRRSVLVNSWSFDFEGISGWVLSLVAVFVKSEKYDYSTQQKNNRSEKSLCLTR